MARRRMTVRRIDPWSVLKFGFVVNACLLVIVLLGLGILWIAISQLGIVERVCGLATDVGFEQCGLDGGTLFSILFLLGVLWVVIQTALYVFLSFLHNLIADLVGGITVGVVEESVSSWTARTPPTTQRPAEQPVSSRPA